MRIGILLLLMLVASGAHSQQKSQEAFPFNLTCEYAENPIGIDKASPNLSWNIQTDKRNWQQSAYQIIVSSDSNRLNRENGNIWNSGKIISHENIQVEYKGTPLRSFMNCWWKVRVWDTNGHISEWSKPAYWKMGILSPGDWKGKWICSDLKLTNYQAVLRSLPDFDMEPESAIWQRADSIRKNVHLADTAPAVYIRKEFELKKTVKRATAYVCGLGLHELYMNGKRVGNEYLNPAYTDYQKRVLYNTYDITGYIKSGTNALGVILGNGWYNLIVPHALRFYTADYIDPPKLLMQLYIEYTDGTTRIIASDSTWRFTTDGPIVYNDILSGETYDACKEMPGWNRAKYTDTNWRNCLSARAPKGILISQQLYHVKKLDSFPAVKVEKTSKGFRFDLGKEICGWVKIKLRGKKGQKVKVYYAGAGSHTLGRYQTDCFILKGSDREVFEPRFSYNGFRYIEVEGIDYMPSAADVEGVLVATDLKKTGEFACSNEKFNKIQQILINTIRNYIVHIPNDPTREKSGWTQDIENGFDVNAYNFDAAEVYIKWQHDFNDIVHKDGYVPPVVPGRFDGPTINGPWWGGMIIYNVAKLYEYYHDSGIVKDSYEAMKKYAGYLTAISKDHIVEWGLGEWMEPFRKGNGARPTTTPIPLTSTVAYYYYIHKMAAFSKIMHKDADAKYFGELAAKIKQSYNLHFFDAQTGQYAQGSQAGQLMSLHFGLVPKGKREIVIQKLKEFIEKQNGYLSTGFVATPILLTTLSDLGLQKEAYEMATKKNFPSWFDMIFTKGNSVMKENWQGGLVQMPSLAGPIGYWFYYSLAGIRSIPGQPGFKQIMIKPDFIRDLSWVSASYQSIQGEIVSKWERQDNRLHLQVKIPANTTALVYLPTTDPDAISEGNKQIKLHRDMKIKDITDKETIISIGSGNYSFSVDIADLPKRTSLIPLPQYLQWTKDSFPVNLCKTLVINDTALQDEAKALLAKTGNRMSIKDKAEKGEHYFIQLKLGEVPAPFQQDEAYHLIVKNKSVVLTANTPHGIFNGLQTLYQLINSNNLITGCDITDYPAYQWRGYMVDVGRNYQSVKQLKQQIDIMSRYKLNVFHFHLTENVAWRLQIKRYPQLTAPANMSRNKGKYYSIEQMNELIQYCKDRYITLVPEIDMPGHSAAFARAMGMDMQSDSGLQVIKNIIREICTTYDIPYIHIGADEVAMKNKRFLPEITDLIHQYKKQVIAWAPGGNYDDKTIRQLWKDEGEKDTRKGSVKYIDSRFLYLSDMAPQTSVVTIFERQLGEKIQGDSNLLGAEICLWDDRRVMHETDHLIMNALYPDMLTFSERSWRGGGYPGIAFDIGPDSSARAKDFAAFEERLIAHKRKYFRQLPFPYVKQTHLHWKLFGPFDNQGDLTTSFWPEEHNVSPEDSAATIQATGGTIWLWHEGPVKAWLSSPKINTTWYAFTRFRSDADTTIAMWIGFKNLSRSGADATPPAGQWDDKKSKIWIDKKLIPPPAWKYPGRPVGRLEEPMTDEGYYYRPPTMVHIKKGWNSILVKLPLNVFELKDWQSPPKWMFTVMPVHKEKGMNWYANNIQWSGF